MEISSQSLGPLHETDAVSVEVFIKAEFRCIIAAAETVEVKMVQREPSLSVFIEQGKCGTRDRHCAVNTEAGCNPPNELGLPTAELSGQGDKAARHQEPTEPFTQRNGFLYAVRLD